MKRLFYSTGILFSLVFLGSCAQHDPNSPDTSGSQPKTQPGVGVDTSSAVAPNTTPPPNTANDQSNNNQEINTGDTSKQRP